jgi:uncharacterized protein YodC (DUF2158 family)
LLNIRSAIRRDKINETREICSPRPARHARPARDQSLLRRQVARAVTSKPHNFKMEFKMLAFIKQASIAVAVTLALSMPLAPAFSASAPSNTAMQNQAIALRSRNLVRLRSGGPLMTVVSIEGDQVNCVWTDRDGHIGSERLPIEALEPGIGILYGLPRPIPDDS